MSAPQPGDRIRLPSMLDDPDPIPPGTTGTVAAVRQQRTWAQVDVEWDKQDGRQSTSAVYAGFGIGIAFATATAGLSSVHGVAETTARLDARGRRWGPRGRLTRLPPRSRRLPRDIGVGTASE
jgi:hypothetical protein